MVQNQHLPRCFLSGLEPVQLMSVGDYQMSGIKPKQTKPRFSIRIGHGKPWAINHLYCNVWNKLETRVKVHFDLDSTIIQDWFNVNITPTEGFVLLIYSEHCYPFVKELSLITSGRPAGYNVSQYPITFSIYMYYLSLRMFLALLPIELNGYYENRAGHFSDLDVWFYPGRQLVLISPVASACFWFDAKVERIKDLRWSSGT